MSEPEYPRLIHVPASMRRARAVVNRHSEDLEALHDLSAPNQGWEDDAPVFPPPQREWFLAVISGKDGSVPPAYSWTALPDLNEGGVFLSLYASDVPFGGAGLENPPLYEVGGNPAVPVGAVVQAWPSEEGDLWQFFYPPPSGGTLSNQAISYSNDTFTFSGSTLNLTSNTWHVDGDTWTFGGTSPITITVNKGTWTFPTYSSPSTAPPAYFVLPVLTGTPPPTWTPPVSGIVICSGKNLFQSNTTATAVPSFPWEPLVPWAPDNYPPPAKAVVVVDVNNRYSSSTALGYDPSTRQFYIGTSSPVTNATSTFQSYSDTQIASVIQGNSSSQSANLTAVYRYPGGPQVYVIRSDGIVQYPTTNSTGTAPTGQLSLPTMTVTGAPTWTPPAGTYPEVWNQVDRLMYAWDGSAWDVLNPAATPVAFSGARVSNSAAQSIASGSPVALTFDTEDYDTDAYHSLASNTSRLTAPTTDKYLIGGGCQFAAGTGVFTVQVKVNGATVIPGSSQMGNQSGQYLSTSAPYALTAGDYVELMAVQTTGGALNVTAQAFWLSRRPGGG